VGGLARLKSVERDHPIMSASESHSGACNSQGRIQNGTPASEQAIGRFAKVTRWSLPSKAQIVRHVDRGCMHGDRTRRIGIACNFLPVSVAVLMPADYIAACAGRQCHNSSRSGTKRQRYWFDCKWNIEASNTLSLRGTRPGVWKWHVMVGDPEMLLMGEAPTEASAEDQVRQVIDRAFKVQQELQTRRSRGRLDRDRR
jgi:hypothetical protein